MGRRELERGRVGRDVTSFISSVWLALMALVCLGRGGLMTQVDWDLRENEKKGRQKNASKRWDPSSTWCYFALAIIIFTVYPQLFFFFFFCSTAVYFRRNLHESYIVVCVLVPTPGAAQVEPQSTSTSLSTSGLVTKDGEARCYFRTGIYRTIYFIIAFNEGTPELAGSVGRVWSLHEQGSQWTARALSLVFAFIYS